MKSQHAEELNEMKWFFSRHQSAQDAIISSLEKQIDQMSSSLSTPISATALVSIGTNTESSTSDFTSSSTSDVDVLAYSASVFDETQSTSSYGNSDLNSSGPELISSNHKSNSRNRNQDASTLKTSSKRNMEKQETSDSEDDIVDRVRLLEIKYQTKSAELEAVMRLGY